MDEGVDEIVIRPEALQTVRAELQHDHLACILIVPKEIHVRSAPLRHSVLCLLWTHLCEDANLEPVVLHNLDDARIRGQSLQETLCVERRRGGVLELRLDRRELVFRILLRAPRGERCRFRALPAIPFITLLRLEAFHERVWALALQVRDILCGTSDEHHLRCICQTRVPHALIGIINTQLFSLEHEAAVLPGEVEHLLDEVKHRTHWITGLHRHGVCHALVTERNEKHIIHLGFANVS
mmetsp:Transcript_44182/g.117011  ORF Transcript_44182/g.117011 Transcript_44182/m.117011 type:complete len:239 (-) Transcript_44182:99-815(-)